MRNKIEYKILRLDLMTFREHLDEHLAVCGEEGFQLVTCTEVRSAVILILARPAMPSKKA